MEIFPPTWQALKARFKAIAVRLLLSFAVTAFVVACNGSQSPEIEPAIEQPSIEATIVTPHPVVVTIVSTSESLSTVPERTSEAPHSTSRPVSTVENGILSPTLTVAIIEATPSPEPTTGPTYTPPASPEASLAEHFWLHRPVPDGNGIWTDKAYPYGSNRGGTLRTHHGVEFNVPAGTNVLAAAEGTVVAAGTDIIDLHGPIRDFYGNVVVIRHGFGLGGQPIFTLYGHLSEILVSVGQQVSPQEVIAHSGATGVADGPHLHFEVRQGENSYSFTRNPLLWLYPFTNRGVVAGRISWATGESAQNYPLTLRRIDAASAYAGTTTYADESVNPDTNWLENFVFDDVVAGYYELVVGSGEERQTTEFWVYPYQTTFVEITLPG